MEMKKINNTLALKFSSYLVTTYTLIGVTLKIPYTQNASQISHNRLSILAPFLSSTITQDKALTKKAMDLNRYASNPFSGINRSTRMCRAGLEAVSISTS